MDQARRRAADGDQPAADAGAGKPGRQWPAELGAQVLERYAAGESGAVIAAAMGLSQWRVYRLLSDCEALRTQSEAAQVRERRQAAGSK